MPGERALGSATLDELLRATHEERRCELINGVVVEKAPADEGHRDAQSEVVGRVHSPYNRRGGQGGPGGWWIRTEVHVALGEMVVCPDIAGWRRERVPSMPSAWPVPVAPDWVTEVLSASTAARDLGVKMRAYYEHGVGHYWVVDRQNQLLYVYFRGDRAYELVLTGSPGDTVATPPFTEVEIDVGRLFGIEA